MSNLSAVNTTLLSYFFRKKEKDFLAEYSMEYGECNPLKIQFNFKTLVDSTNCVTFLDNSDVVAIKLYDNKNSIDKRFVKFDGICALRPLIYDSSQESGMDRPKLDQRSIIVF